MIEGLKKVIALAPHPDDVEFGCGGTVKKLIESGSEVWYVAFSPCNKSLQSEFDENKLFEELKMSITHLGITEERLITYDYPVREFPVNRQLILENLVALNKQIAPDLVFLPNSKDVHQDHQTIHCEGVRAFKNTRMVGYEMPWNSFTFTNNMHCILEDVHLEAKVKALSEYESQNYRNYKDDDFIKGLAKVRGTQIGVDYAEAFENIRWII
ncbi:MAG: LmbE family protein [Bacteroidetes bacterium]|nr:PIG-L family deacetylase [Bacteroidia bacterium]PCH65295.1 MAG: LmbE family protein [Bacteroidota bacterium]